MTCAALAPPLSPINIKYQFNVIFGSETNTEENSRETFTLVYVFVD